MLYHLALSIGGLALLTFGWAGVRHLASRVASKVGGDQAPPLCGKTDCGGCGVSQFDGETPLREIGDN